MKSLRMKGHPMKSVSMRGAMWLAVAALVGGWIGGAAPARAGDFEDGFEDQLGRIAAVSVVRFGAFLLTLLSLSGALITMLPSSPSAEEA